jgi:hypothetical protein
MDTKKKWGGEGGRKGCECMICVGNLEMEGWGGSSTKRELASRWRKGNKVQEAYRLVSNGTEK